MGATLAQTLINKAENILFDVNGTKWSPSELLDWLNDGQREIVLLDPTANVAVLPVQLVAGARQSLPPDGFYMLDIYRNMGTNGATPGPSIRVISKRLLDNFNPSWPVDPANAVVSHFLYDSSDPLHFWVYPPSPGGNFIEINYCARPADLISPQQPIDLIDDFANAILEYMLFRAFSKNAEFTGMGGKAAEHYQAFVSQISGKGEAQDLNDPTQSLIPKPPATRGNES